MSAVQKDHATAVMKRNLESSDDWIVQNNTMETLAMWSEHDDALRAWLIPKLSEFELSDRKSVAGRANKLLTMLAAS